MIPHVLIEPHYLGSLEYFSVIRQAEKITLDVHHHFLKQTFRNRCVIYTASGIKPLSIPVSFGKSTPFKDVKIDHSQSWRRDHWGAIFSAYGKSPFFEYFEPSFSAIYEKKHVFLLDLSVEFLTLCLSLLKLEKEVTLSETYTSTSSEAVFDGRDQISAKSDWTNRRLYQPVPYIQNFGKEFVPNLSILDLLFCEGNQALKILDTSGNFID